MSVKSKILSAVSILLILLPSILYINNSRCTDCAYNQDGIKIPNAEFSEALKVKETFYKFNNQNVDINTVKKDTLSELVNQKKIETYAKKNNIFVNNDELNSLYQERSKQNVDENTLLKKVKEMYGYSKEDYRDVLRQDILRDKVQQKIGLPITEWLNK